MEKLKVGIIGTGNIGTDLLYKVLRSEYLKCSLFMGRREDSEGIRLANELGVKTSTNSIQALIDNPHACDLVFDATSAKVHMKNAPILEKLGIFAVDLTPARVGMICVPVINLHEALSTHNVNMITCGGQATLPLIHAISKIQSNIKYVEVVASIASKSAGAGTRANIDEFTQTTKDAIIELTNIDNAKAIITLNPASPPVNMHNTIFMLIDNPNIDKIRNAAIAISNEVRRYIPGYKLVLEPILENGRVTMTVQVEGAGDYLPAYAGNLDIITCASIRVAEAYAKKRLG